MHTTALRRTFKQVDQLWWKNKTLAARGYESHRVETGQYVMQKKKKKKKPGINAIKIWDHWVRTLLKTFGEILAHSSTK